MAGPLEITSLSAIEHLLSHSAESVERIAFTSPKNWKPRVAALHELAKQAGVQVHTGKERGEPVRATVSPFRYADSKLFLDEMKDKPKSVILALDHLQDPQNFGALCRTAEGLGCDGVLVPKDRGVTVSPGVYHASVGAVATLPVVLVGNLGDTLRKYKDAGYWVVGTTLEEGSTTPGEMPDFDKIILVLGAEWEGMSRTLHKLCDWRVQIPLHGKVQSLNVSATGAILLYELLRKSTGSAS